MKSEVIELIVKTAVACNYELILETANGTLSGYPVTDEDIGFDKLMTAISDLIELKPTPSQFDSKKLYCLGEDYILLKTVSNHRLGSKIDYPFLIVFFDQIIGISLGNFA